MAHTLALLDLPDAALPAVVSGLAEPDKRRFMAACKTALDMTAQKAGMTLRISRDTKFVGIRKVLDSLSAQIHLEIMCLSQEEDDDVKPLISMPLSALSVIMGMVPTDYLTLAASNCQWDCITKVTLKDGSLPSLVPQFVAAACPQLKQLELKGSTFNSTVEGALPITQCSSLTQLILDICTPDEEPFSLPPLHHSPAELQHNLPHIDTLVFSYAANASLIQAFATQLTRLEVTGYDPVVQESVRMCSNLQHLCTEDMVLPDITAALKVLKLRSSVGLDDYFKQLLELPSLSILQLDNIEFIEKDWSGHSCSWQELHIKHFAFTALRRLNLSGLKRLSIEPDATISLPDPDNPDGLAAVQRAAANLSHIGRISVAQHKPDAYIRWMTHGTNAGNQQRMAEILAAAAECVSPAKGFRLTRFLPVLNTLVKWGQASVEAVWVENGRDLQPDVWQALQQLQQLKMIDIWKPVTVRSGNNEETSQLFEICKTVCLAAQRYVIHVNRSLLMKFNVFVEEEFENLESDCQRFLSEAIQGAVPAGSKLVRVQRRTFPHQWEVAIAPTHSTAQ